MSSPRLIIFYLIIFFGVFLRFFKLDSQSIWIDEYITSYFVNNSDILKIFLDTYVNDPHPPLFYMLTHFITKISGNSEMSLRFISFLFGAINLFVVHKFMRSFFSEEITFIAMTLFAFSSYQIYYCQEARMYSVFLMVSILIIYYFLISLKYNSFLKYQYIVVSIIGLYLHVYTLLLIIILNIIYFFLYKEDIREDEWIRANTIILIFYIPMLPFLFKTIILGGVAVKENILIAPIYSFKSFLFGLTVKMNFLLMIFCLFFIFIISLAILSNRRYKEKKVIDILFLTAIIFALIPWIESIFGKPVYSNRTLIPVSFILLVLISVGISYLFQGIKIFTIILYLVINLYSLYNYYFVDKYQKINYKILFDKVKKEYNIKNKEIIIHTNIPSYTSFEYLNKYKNKTGFENRYISEIPEYGNNKVKILIREMWRKFKERFKIDVYAGYDKNILTEKELNNIILNYIKVYLVIDDKNGLKQIDLPNSHLWEIDYIPYKVYNLDNFWWMKNFKIKEMFEIYGSKLYILEKLQ